MSSPDLTNAEREAVAAVLRTPNLSMGSEIEKFEDSVSKYTGCNQAIGVSSGTTGLHLCVRAAGIKEMDMVITTPFSFVSSANVLLFERAIPVFVDVDPLSGCINPTLVRQAAEDLIKNGKSARKWLPRSGAQKPRRLKTILPVDVFGQPADMDPIIQTSKEFGLTIIEDSCEALGAEYKNRLAGTLGDYGVFAFYPNKQITTGEGGLVITNNNQAADMIRSLRNQGRAPGDTWLQHTFLGYNYRLNEMSAALGRVQMGRLEELLRKREAVASWYNQRLEQIEGIEIPNVLSTTTRMSWFVYVIRFSEGFDRDQIADKLKSNGIPARPYFIPIHLQPYMVDLFDYRPGDFPITENLGQRSLALPFSSVMTEEQVDLVTRALEKALGR